MWVKMGGRLLNLEHFTTICKACEYDEWFVYLDLIKLPMDDEADADRFVMDIAEAIHDGATLMYWYDN